VDVRVCAALVTPLTVINMAAGLASASSQTREVRPGGPSSSVRAATQSHAGDPALLLDRFGGGEGWAIIRMSSDNDALVFDVEARRLGMARSIAIEILRPLRSRRYHEILIYVRLPGSDVKAAMRRIQWTPRGGIVETKYASVP
jgi:hypothetical protein